MDCDENDNSSRYVTALEDDDNRNAVNSVILDYYKKIGRKRDLEQYFSLSTANSELRDPTGTFWRRMKSENDSSDSGDKKSENTSSQELCRISIRCSMPDPSSSQGDNSKTKTESVSPPIITEETSSESGHNSDADSVKSGSVKSDDNQSQKSYDVLLDTSMNKPFSPTSSITSQRKLEWDSLADVGYANESDRKTSASNLSTLERLALIQQYSNNDNNSANIGVPTAHSTPLEENESKSKTKKGIGKKSTKIYQKDVDLVEVNVPDYSNTPNSINVNLTKHISFNVEKDGKITVENIQKDVSVSPEKTPLESDVLKPTYDKEIQTSLVKTKEANLSPVRQPVDSQSVKIPVMISLNTLRKKTRRKKIMAIRKKLKQKKSKANVVIQEKSGEQLSEAESFEYMPGHIYNQNQLQAKEQIRKERPLNAAGNKSSLESSGVLTTDSSKSVSSFGKDLEKSIELLKNALKDRDDVNLRKQLIKQICERLVKSKYRDDDSNSEFLSNFTFTGKKTSGNRNFTTTSTSDGNESGDKLKKPKKSILRNDKFASIPVASTSQSVPNLFSATEIDKPAISNLIKQLTTSNTDSEISSKEKSSDTVFAKQSSGELYQKYLAALRREQAYKQHLKDKKMFLKQKLGNSDTTFNAPIRDAKVNNRLQDLIKDLTRNNYDDGSGDASKLEGGPSSNTDFDRFLPVRTQRSQSVFTLSSGNSDYQTKKCNLKKRLQSTIKDLAKPGPSYEHYCCCPHHSGIKPGVTDSSVQVNSIIPFDEDSSNGEQRSRNTSRNRNPQEMRRDSTKRESRLSPRSRNGSPKSKESPRKEPYSSPRDIKCYCICGSKRLKDVESGEYQCVKHRTDIKNEDKTSKKSSASSSCSGKNRFMVTTSDGADINKPKKTSKSSQTNLLIKMLRRQSSEHSGCSCPEEQIKNSASSNVDTKSSPTYTVVYEATRCLQTEISINPNVSDPTLSDVNIVTDSSCAKLISEGRRETTKTSISDIYSREGCSTGSNKSSGTSKNIKNFDEQCIAVTDMEEVGPSSNEAMLNAPVQSPSHTPIHSLSHTPVHTPSHTSKLDIKEPNYEIPIQGTNMTVLVSINSNERKPVEQNKVSSCVGTDLIDKNEQGTCLAEENSKGIQYEIVKKSDECDRNVVQKQAPLKITSATNTFVTNLATGSFNTYPRNATNERTACRRPTDPSPLQKVLAETDISKECSCGCGKMDCDCHANDQTLCKRPEIVKGSNICSCGCKHDLEKCGVDCSERKKIICSCGCGQQNCTENCLNCDTELSEKKDICSCGCSKNKNECGKSCGDCKGSKISNDDDVNGPCPCGCGGTKSKCRSDCSKLPPSDVALPRKEVGVQKCSPLETSKDIQVNMNEIENPKFSTSLKNIKNAPVILKAEVKRMTKADDVRRKMQADNADFVSSENDYDLASPDHIIEKIQSITRRYSKKNLEKSKKKKCFKEIMNIMAYLLDTEDSSDRSVSSGETSTNANMKKFTKSTPPISPKRKKDSTLIGSPKNDKKPVGSLKNVKKQENSPCGKKDNNRENNTQRSPQNRKSQESFSCASPKNNKNQEPICGSPKPNEVKKTSPHDSSKNDSIDETEYRDLPKNKSPESCEKPKLVEKAIQSCINTKFKLRKTPAESSDFAYSELQGTSTDSAACKILSKIRKECDRYHQRQCKIHGRKREGSSSTSVNCSYCRRVHHCNCKTHKCKNYKKCHHEKCTKKPVAYNLIIQTSDSIMSEDNPCDNRKLKNVVVKVPPLKVLDKNLPFKEVEAKIESRMYKTNRNGPLKCCRSRSMPNESEISSLEEIIRKSQGCTVREYLEKNRPDFVKNSTDRLQCLKFISGSRPEDQKACPSRLKMVVVHKPDCYGSCNGGVKTDCVTCYNTCAQNEVRRIETDRAAKRDLLSLYVEQLSNVNELTPDELQQLSKELGRHIRQKKPQKLISEREMKKHSEKIYKSLPEVVQKKEDAKKESEKKTNLLLANMFKKNLQKKTLRGSVNLSNYSTVIKL